MRPTKLLLLTVFYVAARAQNTQLQPDGNSFPGPGQPSPGQPWVANLLEWKRDPAPTYERWLEELKVWRTERLTRMGYSDGDYTRPDLLWSQRNFIQPQMMAHERYFYDLEQRRYTVDRYVDDLEKRYGGIDSVLVWPVYPNIGIDNRNQFDMHRDMPGGIAGLKAMVEDFHRRNVRVFFPTMAWDEGTRDVGVPQWEAVAKLVAETGADGINGDTFSGLPRAYRTATDALKHPVVLFPEGAPTSDEGLIWNTQGWTQPNTSFVPGVNKAKWLETRHMPVVTDRWAKDKTNDLQFAWFNGIGYCSWENVWGFWNGITERDGELIRRVARLERAYPALLVSKDWQPHYPTLNYGVYSSRFPGNGVTLYTLVNRNEYPVQGGQFKVEHVKGRSYFDLWNGSRLDEEVAAGEGTLRFPIAANGFGAVLAVDSGRTPANLDTLLREIADSRPLESYSGMWQVLPQKMVDIAPVKAAAKAPEGMIAIPHGTFDFRVNGVEQEGKNAAGLDVQYPWETVARRYHLHTLEVKAFHIDKYPVTNAQFKKFVDASHYHPADDHNFLRDWVNGAPQSGWENKPVAWVSLEDARAYAKWAGKRLPHEWEWQYAAQGGDGRLYPWGNTWNPTAVPMPYKGRDLPGPASVDAHPGGVSPFGVMDMVGNVWQWTDEFQDEHTRAAIIRGGSYYQPQNSVWYFAQTYKLTEHGKYLLLAPSEDRAGTLGFRCVIDVE